jgi:hypothetical protein
MRRILLTAAALLIPVAGLTLGFAGTAGAAGKIECTTLSGNASGTITLGGCTGGVTGGSSVPVTATTLATGGTIHWVSGGSTTIGAPTLTAVSAKKCPGYVKNAATEPTGEAFTAVVTGDAGDGMLIPGAVSGEVCIGTDGTITLLKAVKFSWASSSIACTTISGSVSGNITVSGCTGGDTGGGSVPVAATTLATGGTIHWVSGGSTTIGAPTLTSTSAKKCPGYVKNAATEPTAEDFSAVVSSDTGDGLKLPGTAKGAVCLGTHGSIAALKPLSAK